MKILRFKLFRNGKNYFLSSQALKKYVSTAVSFHEKKKLKYRT